MPGQVMSEKPLQGLHFSERESHGNAANYHRRLEGKVAIVTCGAKGTGEAAVQLFARHGMKVIVADIEDVRGEALVSSLAPNYYVTYVHCDLSLEPDVESMISSMVSRYGHLDILFNNAGVLGSQLGKSKSILNFDANEFDRVMRVNVRGTALGMKHAGERVHHLNGQRGRGPWGPVPARLHSVEAHAIVGLTQNAACELGQHGIRVNCISPFGVATSMLVNAWGGGGDQAGGGGDECMSFGVPCEQEVENMEEFGRSLANLRGPTLRAKDKSEAALYLAIDESKYVSGHN